MTSEKELKARVAELESITDMSPVGVFRMNVEGSLVYINEKYTEITGYQFDRIQQIDWTQAIHPDDQQPMIDEWLRSAQEAIPFKMEFRFLRPDGRATWVLAQTRAETDEAGEITGYIGTVTDITERKQMEQQLRDREAELTEAKNIAGLGRWSWDMVTGEITGDEQSDKIYGFPPGSQVNFSMFANRLHPDEADKVLQQLEEIVASQVTTYSLDYRIVRPNGEVLYIATHGHLKRNDQGQALKVVGVAQDITERRQAEAERDRLTAIIEATVDFVGLADAEGRLLYINRAGRQMVGLDETADLAERTMFDFISEDIITMVTDEIIPVAIQDGLWQGEFYLRTVENNRVPVSSVFMSHKSATGEVQFFSGIYRDMTERLELELEQERLQREIIEAQQRTIQELSTPVIPVMAGIIVMPLIGSLDSLRARDLMQTLLQGISQHRAKIIILDITGVPIVDTGIAAHLDKTIQAARLKGARTIVTGISDAVAETIVDLGIDWSRVETLRDLQTGLMVALGSLGVRLANES